LVSELSTLVMAPNYRIGVPLMAIAVVLIFRPQGLFGQPYIRK
jgi:branched-subunit amino acid ABC-type transport system permease component